MSLISANARVAMEIMERGNKDVEIIALMRDPSKSSWDKLIGFKIMFEPMPLTQVIAISNAFMSRKFNLLTMREVLKNIAFEYPNVQFGGYISYNFVKNQQVISLVAYDAEAATVRYNLKLESFSVVPHVEHGYMVPDIFLLVLNFVSVLLSGFPIFTDQWDSFDVMDQLYAAFMQEFNSHYQRVAKDYFSYDGEPSSLGYLFVQQFFVVLQRSSIYSLMMMDSGRRLRYVTDFANQALMSQGIRLAIESLKMEFDRREKSLDHVVEDIAGEDTRSVFNMAKMSDALDAFTPSLVSTQNMCYSTVPQDRFSTFNSNVNSCSMDPSVSSFAKSTARPSPGAGVYTPRAQGPFTFR